MELLKKYLIPWSISNAFAIVLLIIALKKTKLARLLFAVLFSWACWTNYTMAQNDPEGYLAYTTLTPFSLYADFINGWFKEHVTAMVSYISIGQGLIAVGMILKGWLVKLACIGSIIFFMAITPLGIGSGFPFPIIASIAIYFIWKNDDFNWLWRFKQTP